MVRLILPSRRPDSRKGDNGRVLIVGGSETYVGAVALAGLAALRSGCDIVTIAAPQKTAWAISAISPDLITVKLPGVRLCAAHYARIRALAAAADVVCIGNGAGIHPDTQRLIRRLATLPNKKVIDADGIKAIATTRLRDAILTPHRHEFELFLRNVGIRIEDAQRVTGQMRTLIAQDTVILLKGPADQILSEDGIDTIAGGNAGLTRGGTGDVLAGLVAGLWAQGLPQRQAAVSASILNKRIGDLLKRRHGGYSYLASDMVAEIARVTAHAAPRAGRAAGSRVRNPGSPQRRASRAR